MRQLNSPSMSELPLRYAHLVDIQALPGTPSFSAGMRANKTPRLAFAGSCEEAVLAPLEAALRLESFGTFPGFSLGESAGNTLLAEGLLETRFRLFDMLRRPFGATGVAVRVSVDAVLNIDRRGRKNLIVDQIPGEFRVFVGACPGPVHNDFAGFICLNQIPAVVVQRVEARRSAALS